MPSVCLDGSTVLDLGCRVAMDRPYARRVLPSDAQCVPRWVDSPDFERHGPVPLRIAYVVYATRRPPVHLGAWVFRTLDVVLPWIVPLRAVSSRQMRGVCLDWSTVRTLDGLFVITNSDPRRDRRSGRHANRLSFVAYILNKRIDTTCASMGQQS
ncbi:hypothetical protein B0H14DRAFT_3448871 [Mycena olivaceomarginata]|nr:hypothetical protein B0H14DRAFT_3448871 [Mycena olivaceomarginata]